MATAPRRLALEVLGQVARGGRTLARALARAEIAALEPRDRAFLHELVLGTLRRRGALDFALERMLDHPAARLEEDVRDALRLGAYQILFLRVPAHAAVSETVDLVRDHAPRATGLANAVLRRLDREGSPVEPDPRGQPLEWLTTVGSLPRWLAERWLHRLGAEGALARARAFLEPAPTHVRWNPRVGDAVKRAEALGISVREAAVPGAFAVAGEGVPRLADAGVLYVQDQGSQLVARLALTRGRMLDACAAPGGKALLLADEVGLGGGRVIAADVSRRRLRTLRELNRRWGSPGVLVVAADAGHPPFRQAFGGVLLDAPCSALGTLARHPDVRWRRRAGDLERHARRQRGLLEAVAPLVQPGGRLVYAACSDEPEETGHIVGAFLESHRDFALEPLPDWARRFGDESGFARTSPESDGGDAFFAAPLRRVG